jgi:hypothetical protein
MERNVGGRVRWRQGVFYNLSMSQEGDAKGVKFYLCHRI